MDEIAMTAQVSKQTIYKHFTDKQSLFIELVTRAADEIIDPLYGEVRDLAAGTELTTDLSDLARRLLTGVLQPQLLDLRRLVIAESSRFPEIGQAFYERGPGRTIAALSEALERLAEAGALQIPDAKVAAAQFNWLVMGEHISRAMLLGNDSIPTRREIDRHAEVAVRVFLAAYPPAEAP